MPSVTYLRLDGSVPAGSRHDIVNRYDCKNCYFMKDIQPIDQSNLKQLQDCGDLNLFYLFTSKLQAMGWME